MNNNLTFISILLLGIVGLIFVTMAFSGNMGNKIKGTNASIQSNNWFEWFVIGSIIVVILWYFIYSISGK